MRRIMDTVMPVVTIGIPALLVFAVTILFFGD